jgi:hypothetical protein
MSVSVNTKHLKIYIFKGVYQLSTKCLELFYHKRIGWIKVFGLGVHFKDMSRDMIHIPRKKIKIGKWEISYVRNHRYK